MGRISKRKAGLPQMEKAKDKDTISGRDLCETFLRSGCRKNRID